MLRFSFSLIAATLVSLAAYANLGQAISPAQPQLKVIAVVTAHAHQGALAVR